MPILPSQPSPSPLPSQATSSPSPPLGRGQIEVLRILSLAAGPLSCRRITDRFVRSRKWLDRGTQDRVDETSVLRHLVRDWDDPHGTRPSLFTRGYVEKVILDIDGIEETTYRITDEGRRAYESLGEVAPPSTDND